MRLLVVGDFQGKFSEKLTRKLKKEEFDLIIGVGDYAGISEWRPYIMYSLGNSRKGLEVKSPDEFFGKERFKNLLKKDENSTKNVLKKLNSFGKPVISIFGNGDDDWYKYKFDSKRWPVKKSRRTFLKKLDNFHDITYGVKKLKGFNFVGFGGYMDIDAYFDKKLWKGDSIESIRRRILRRKNSKNNLFSRLRKTDKERIFVLHYPPKGVFDIIRDKKDNPMNCKSAGIGFFREAILKYKPRLVLCGHMHEYQGIKKIGKSLVINPGDAEKDKYAIVDILDDGRVRVKFY